jgi:hypothetical protein
VLGAEPRGLPALLSPLPPNNPEVTTFSPWNELNHHTQPIAGRADLAAAKYEVMREECPQCTIVALDSPYMRRYVRAFRRHVKGDPQLLGLHNYRDANRFRTWGTDTMLREVPGEV